MRILAFVLALLLLAGTVEPSQGWLIVLVSLTGIAAFRLRPGAFLRPALDVRIASFALAVLLLAGTVEPTKDWLIALSAVTGVAAFMPRLISLDRGENDWRWRRHRNGGRWVRWQSWDPEGWR
jgi:hypothetical protein